MVSRDYLLHRPLPPSPARVFFDQKILPFAINAAWIAESGLESVARGARATPLRAVAVALAAGCLLGSLIHPNRS